MNKDYGEILCESIKIIGESLLENVKYDQTIQCKIIDDTDAQSGKYRVSNGATSFIAYSTEKYSKDADVYVTIPNGDYNNDKLIMGKIVDKTENIPYNYVSPYENFVDVTGNLLAAIDFEGAGLLANDDQLDGDKVFIGTIAGNQLNGDSGKLEGFTRLGLRASFRSLLQEYNCVGGDYGLELQVTFELLDSTNATKKTDIKYLYLNTENMIGNPYNFETYFMQEELFDITNFGAITKIDIYFKQKGNFLDSNYNYIPCKNDSGLEDDYLWDNLFVKDIWIAAGYDVNEHEGEFVQLYTLDSHQYSPEKEDSENQKTIYLRWMHEDEQGKKYPIDSSNENEIFEIRWYQYKLGEPAADIYGGVNWELINDFENNKRKFSATIMPKTSLSSEQVKVIIVHGEGPKYVKYEINPFTSQEDYDNNYYRGYYILYEREEYKPCISGQIWSAENVYYQLQTDENGKVSYVQCGENPFSSQEDFDKNYAGYYIRIVMSIYQKCSKEHVWSEDTEYYFLQDDTRKVYRSEVIIFTNDTDIPNQATLEALQALTLHCYDYIDGRLIPSYGNYLLYNEQNELIDQSQANIQRIITWDLALSDGGAIDFTKATVRWSFPTGNSTMLRGTQIQSEISNKVNEIETEIINNACSYYIGNHYSISYSDNTVSCSVTYKGVTYNAAQELTFGQAGTMGASGTFVIDYVDDQHAITVQPEKVDGAKTIQAILYDENNELVDLSGYTVTWSWHTSPKIQNIGDDHITISPQQGTITTITPDNRLTLNECYILKATLSGWNNTSSNTSYDLEAYLPIALRSDLKYTHITGADRIVYTTDGTPNYYKGHYVLHSSENEHLTEGWGETSEEVTLSRGVIKFPSDTIEPNEYFPSLKVIENKEQKTKIWKLSPSPLFYEGMTTAFAVQYIDSNKNILWTQPILVILSRYFSSMINKWDGQTLTLDNGLSTILASRIGAGRKNSSNQFSGVLLGDWKGQTTEDAPTFSNTGLFGFRDGLMSFGFKDDGTAFIGTKAAGQLQFDGKNSTISSASYRVGDASGMQIDFNAPSIQMRQYFTDNVRVVKGNPVNTYMEFKEIKDSQEWIAIGRTDLYILIQEEGKEDSYQRVSVWNDAYKEKMFYEIISQQQEYPPFKGITNETEFNKKLTDYKVSRFRVNLSGTWDYASKWDKNKYDAFTIFYHPDIDIKAAGENRTVNINAAHGTYPLQIGSKFKVKWDGTLETSDGKFSGTITGSKISGSSVSTTYLSANNGYIGGWTIAYNYIKGSGMTLYSDGTIDGGTIRGSALEATGAGSTMSLKGYIQVKNNMYNTSYGYIGQLNSDASSTERDDAQGIGIFYSQSPSATATMTSISEIKATGINCGMNFPPNWVSVNSNYINFGGPIKLNSSADVKINPNHVSYGPDKPEDVIGNGVNGQLYFKIP